MNQVSTLPDGSWLSVAINYGAIYLEFCLVPLSVTNEREHEVTMEPSLPNATTVSNDLSNITSEVFVTSKELPEFPLKITTTKILKTVEKLSTKNEKFTSAKGDEKAAVNHAENSDSKTGKLQHNMCENIYNAESRGNLRRIF